MAEDANPEGSASDDVESDTFPTREPNYSEGSIELQQVVHEFGAVMGLVRQPSPDQRAFELLSESQRGELIKNDDASDERQYQLELKAENNRVVYAVLAVVGVLAICWLFLAYQQSDHIDAIITAVVGLLGGFGLGRASAK